MHNSFLACVLSYHNLKRENTSTFSHSEIMWPKAYLTPLLPEKRSSLVKGWAVRVPEIPRFHLPRSCPSSSRPACCQAPGATNHSCPQASSATGQGSTSPPEPASALLRLLIHPLAGNPVCRMASDWRARRWDPCGWGKAQCRATNTLQNCALKLIYSWKVLLVQIVHKAYDLSACPQGHNNIYVA